MTCGTAIDGQADAPARRRRTPAAARAGRGAAHRHGPVRRPLRLHGGLRAAGPRGGARGRRPQPAPARAGGRALRRHRRQVHRRQHHGDLRRARSPTRTTPSAPCARGSGCSPRWTRSTPTSACATGRASSCASGINTGEVLAGEVAGAYTVMGDAVNVASRLQSAGRPGSVTVGEQTWRATRHRVEYVPLEPLTLKGKSEPVPAWEGARLLTEHRGPARASGRPGPSSSGRVEELALVESAYRRVVAEGRAHLVTIVGEAGVGKTRLLRELAARLDGAGEAPIRARGPLPALRLGHRLLGAGRGAARGVRDRRRGQRRRRAREARRPRARAARRRRRRDRPSRCSAPCSAWRTTLDLDPQRRREAFQAAARALDRGDGRRSARSSSPSRTSTGPTTACSTSSSTSRSGRGGRC